ncbi:MAG: hypothetical protein JWN12_463 [Candidatus Saccharibacteria bacterium]|nr:hypothetical protein [Candidatus Saccharibacteria bacterium]
MATYKVPQDVEADDKLIGPFSFRQFIYLIIVALSGALAWGLAQLFIGLAIIPLPIILLFGALALPLRKDQPMEIYLAAIISYYLKPHKRLWDPDGVESLIEITVPKVVEIQRSKNISQADAEQRFSYLAGIVDSGGWAIRGTGAQASPSTTLNNDIFLEAQSAEDVLDGNNAVAQSFNSMMTKEADRVRQEAIDRMRQAPTTVTSTPTPVPVPAQQATPQAAPVYNPYPNIQQTVIQPIDDLAHSTTQPAPTPVETPMPQTAPTTSDKPLSADIMNLANNPDLSIETIAREAHRLQEKENDMSEEVVISLR